MSPREVDHLVIGGGFYGCCLALFLRSAPGSVLLVEAGERLMERASRVNQARVHTGFHYPRSALTAMKSMALHRRFAADFPEAVVSDFRMLYAIARRRSKVSAKRFHRMFDAMGAPIAPASASEAALFDPAYVEEAFSCQEWAFDWSVLREALTERLDRFDTPRLLGTAVTALEETPRGVLARLSNGEEILARQVFNVTYAQINHVLRLGGLPEAALKHELAELALVEPPEELRGRAVTVMDGPFFSCMPYPSEGLYSLTHVRYTPHVSWTDRGRSLSAYETFARASPQSMHRHMIADSARYMPCLAGATWKKSIYDVKSVLVKNENDDGRPILVQTRPETSRVMSVMGGKIDNIYDLFAYLRSARPEWAEADARFVTGRAA